MPSIWDDFTVIEEPALEAIDWEEFQPLPEPLGPLPPQQLPPGANLADVLRQPSLVQPPWEGGVVRSSLPGILQPEDLAPASRLIGGGAIPREIGDIAPVISEPGRLQSADLSRFEEEGLKVIGPPPPVPEFPKLKISPYEQAEIAAGHKVETGMEPGTELTTAIGEAVGREAALTGDLLARAWEAGQGWRDPLAAIETLTKPIVQATGEQTQSLGEAAWRLMYPSGDVDWEQLRKQAPGLMMLPEAYRSIIKSSPQIGAVSLLQAAGVPSPVAAGFIFGATPEGFSPENAIIAAGIPVAGEAGEALAAGALKKVPIVKVALEQVGANSDQIRGKIIQGIGGVQFSSDTFRKFLEKGGSFAAVNAYMLAAETPEILALPPDERKDAILQKVAQNIGPAMIGFLHQGEMSRSLAGIGREIAPDLAKFLREFKGRPRASTTEEPTAGRPGPVRALITPPEAPPSEAAPVVAPKPPVIPPAPAAAEAQPTVVSAPVAPPTPQAVVQFSPQYKQPFIEVTIQKPDGSTYTAEFNGWQDMREVGGELIPSIGRPTDTGVSHGGLYPGEKILTKLPTPEEWAPMRDEVKNRFSPVKIAESLGIELKGSNEKRDIYLYRHGKTGAEQIVVPAGSDIDVVRSKIEAAKERIKGTPETIEGPTPTPKPAAAGVTQKPHFRGTSLEEWKNIQAGQKPKSPSGAWVTSDKPYAEAYMRRAGATGVLIEYKPSANQKLKMLTADPGDVRRQGDLRISDVQRVYDASGKVIYEAPAEGAPPAAKPAAAPAPAPAPAVKPPQVPADVETMLRLPVPEVTEARKRLTVFRGENDNVRRQFGELDQQIRELEKRILNTRGRARGKIKSATTKADRDKYRALQEERGKLRTQMATIDQISKADREAVEKADDIAIINDPKQPLLRRLDRLYRMQGSQDPAIAQALSAETYRVIREKYPDATDAELQRIASEVQRAAYLGEDPWKSPSVPTVPYLREQAVIAIIGHPDAMPFQQLPDALKEKINRYTKHFRSGFEAEPKPVEEISAAGLEALRKEVLTASNNVRREIAAKEAAAKKAEEEAAAQEEKLLVEAQAVADSAGKPGTKGGRTAKEVRDELVAKIHGAIEKVIAHDKTTLTLQEGGDYLAVGQESGDGAFGTIEPSKGGFKVTARNIKASREGFSVTVKTEEQAKFVIKAMASRGVGKVVIGVPGDGVFRLLNDGPTLLSVWRQAKAIDISAGGKVAIRRGEAVEPPPDEIKTGKDWREAVAYHDLTEKDQIYDWSPALRKVAQKVNPEQPETVTVADVEKWIEEQGKPPTVTAPKPPPEAPAPAPAAPPEPAPAPAPAPAAPAPAAAAGAAPAPGKPLITKERADAIRERLKKKLAERPPVEEQALEDMTDEQALEAKAKVDPSIFSDAVQIGAHYIQSGLHKFEDWAAQMRKDFGEAIESQLRSIYETARITIESPSGQESSNLRPGLQPGLRPPEDRVVTARTEQTKPYSEYAVPAKLLPHLEKHQRHGVSVALTSMNGRGGALIADGTGVGKTREALAIAQFHAGLPGTKVLIITRAETIKPDWKKGTFGGSYFNDAKAMGIKVRLAKDAVLNPGEIGITTYENTKAVEKNSDPNTVLIWDESHSLKNKSQRGVNGDRANAKAKSVLFMSATPADKPEHIYYLTRMGIMEGKTEGQQLKDLGMMLVKMDKLVKDEATGQMVKKRVHFWAPDPAIPEAERNARFNALFDRMTQNGAMIKREISMQGVHVQVLKVSLPPEAHETLQTILHFFEADTIDDLKGLKKAIVLMHLRRQQEPFKIAPTVLLTQRELEAGRQVVIFVSRVNESEVGKWVKGPGDMKIREVLMSSEGTAKALRNALHEAGIHDIAEIHGEADQASLEAMADFQEGKKRVVIATIESGGTGINLDDIVGNRPRTMIVVTAPFDAVGNVQAAGRIWRLKTLSGANMFYLFGDTDVDDWNADIIGSKMATLGAIVEGQVRRLDIANPESVNTDDFHGTVRRKKPGAPAPGGPQLPKLDWVPYTTKAGNQIFKARITPEVKTAFWAWWGASGKAKNPLGITTSPYEGVWHAWARRLPPEPAAPPAAEPPPAGAPPAEPPPASDPEVGPGGETELHARHGTATGLPPGVPDGGPNFAQELLEASRRLGTLVRSRTTLPAGTLGRYVIAIAAIGKADKIEVGDIQNQATVAHEMGHDLDALIFPTVFGVKGFHSQESLAKRIGHADKKVLFKELAAISELMRGPIAVGSPGHQKYRKRATELIADFFSLYAHDPARARAMAPEWSKGFEAELRKNPNADSTVRELLARNVEPVAPAGGAPTGPAAAGMPGAVPAREPVLVPREAEAAIAAENLVKGEIRRFEAEVQKARIRAENWREQVPNRMDRNDVGAFVEGTGNLEIPGDTRDAVIARMTPAKKEFTKAYRFQIELQRQRINEYLKDLSPGEYLQFLEDYLPHFYVNSKTPGGQQAVARFIKNSPNARQRKLPSLREAVELGLVPITQDPTVLYEMHARINWRVATNRRFLAQLKTLTTAAGGPVVVPAGKNPGGWPVSNNPLIQRVYAHATPGGLMLWRGGAAIHPDIWHAVRQILETPTSTDAARLYDAINAVTRANAFAFSFFHDITLRSASLGALAKPVNPLRGLFMVLERDPVSGELKLLQSTRKAGKKLMRNEESVADAALHGLKFAWTESESYQHGARDLLEKLAVRLRNVPFLGKTARFARDIQRFRQEGLWRDTHDAFKIIAYHYLVNKALSTAPPGTDPKRVKQMVASLLNDAFGGQEWQTKFWLSPQVRRNVARFWLAPDWTLSTLRSVPFLSDVASITRGQAGRMTGRGPEPTQKEGWRGNIGRARFWTAELAALAIATIAAQFAIYQAFGRKEKGDKPWIWENEEGQNRRIDVSPLMRQLPWAKPDDPTRYYVNMGKRPEEILAWFVEPQKNIQSKMARPLIEIIRQITGSEGEFKAEWERDHQTFVESLPARAKSAGGELVPFVFAGNQFALSLPYRKGMTKYKAEQAFQSAYELIAEPSRVRSALRGNFSGNMDRLLEDIRDAALRNGVPVEEVEKRARSAIRGSHYHKYFRAFKDNDQKIMERETDALDRLGVRPRDIQQNIRRREAFEPIPY